MPVSSVARTLSLDLSGEEYYDRVYGCWQGKNAGGTLGTPLEKAYGEPDPFDVWWYPKLESGGLPNDDLEMQLAWLKAIEEVGPELTARDLARYWLDHIGYNFDEYGLSKTNLRLGLEPPVSGAHNNWFTDCMGSPIRSEIWACCAPGAPRIAARLAIQDALCDHAGGEGVYGEIFNAALESAAFVIQDHQRLIDIALSYIPAESASARAVRAVLAARAAGVDWKQARSAVLAAVPHYVAQYSPINLGFQVIGLLYGDDFGHGMCITVNCGYDTDSSGAAIGSYLGVIYGSKALPTKWVEPLGDTISTNESWGGVKHLSKARRPVPQTLDELVRRIRSIADRVLRHHHLLDQQGRLTTTIDELFADPEFAAEAEQNVYQLTVPGRDLEVAIDYGDSASIHADLPRSLVTRLTNRREEAIEVRAAIAVPAEWTAPAAQSVTIAPDETADLLWSLDAVPRTAIGNSNRLRLDLELAGRPTPPPVPFVLAGAFVHRLGPTLPLASLPGSVDPLAGDQPTASEVSGWPIRSVRGNDLELGKVIDGPGLTHVQARFTSPVARSVWISIDSLGLAKVWLNGVEVHRVEQATPVRPNLSGSPGSGFSAALQAGDNELLIRLVHTGEGPAQAYLAVCSDDRFRAGLPEIGRTLVLGDSPASGTGGNSGAQENSANTFVPQRGNTQ